MPQTRGRRRWRRKRKGNRGCGMDREIEEFVRDVWIFMGILILSTMLLVLGVTWYGNL
jgi:hypothetical protein